jgi:NTE family protein
VTVQDADRQASATEEWEPDRGPEVAYGLALSGGGYRATLFHLGAILRLNELGRLRSVGRVSSVSGGSFAAGLLARAWPGLQWDAAGRATNLGPLFRDPVLDLTGRRLDIPLIALGLIPGVNPASLLARRLDGGLFGGMTLQDLPADGDGPRFIFCASEPASGTLFRFSRPYLGSYRIGLVKDPTVRLADAVAASAAFPPVMSPLVLRLDPTTVLRVPGADLWDEETLRRRVALLDGGVYDNLALEPIVGRCRTYLVSDAGGNFGVDTARWKSWLWSFQLKRTLDTATAQARALRRRALMVDRIQHPFALWRTITDPLAFGPDVATPFTIDPAWPRYLAGLSTRMWPPSRVDRDRLVNWGYLTADLAIRAYIWKQEDPPTSLPFPDATFDQAPSRAPRISGPVD